MPLITAVVPEDLDVRMEWFELLQQVGEEMLDQEGITGAEVSLLLTNDTHIHELNKKWRGIDAPTDVLSFALREGERILLPAEGQPELLGDVVISVPRAQIQAEKYDHSVERELAFLLTHGILHLLGYDHQTRSDAETMEIRQEAVLSDLGLGRRGRGV